MICDRSGVSHHIVSNGSLDILVATLLSASRTVLYYLARGISAGRLNLEVAVGSARGHPFIRTAS